MQKELDKFDNQILSWEKKLSRKIDYYNHKFTALEVLMSEMNNQSGMIMGLQGGY